MSDAGGGAAGGAAVGAGAGFLVGGPLGAGLGAALGGSMGGSLGGGKSAAKNAGRAAQAQQAAALDLQNRTLEFAQTSQANAVSAAQSPQELAALGEAYGAQQKQLTSDQQLLASIDPTIMEASKQALGLLRGENAQSVAPELQARQTQRMKLLNNLRSQLGPGAETSSAGQQALNQFDMQTNQLQSQLQQSSLGQLLGVSLSGRPNVNADIAGIGNIAQGYGNAAGRLSNAYLGSGQNLLNAFTQTGQNVVNTAGSQYVQGQLQGQAQQSMFNALANATATGAGYAAARPSGGGNYQIGQQIPQQVQSGGGAVHTMGVPD